MGTDKHSAVVQVIHCRKDPVGTANTLYWAGLSHPRVLLIHKEEGGCTSIMVVCGASTSITLRFQLHS